MYDDTNNNDALCTVEIAAEEVGAEDKSGSQVETGKVMCWFGFFVLNPILSDLEILCKFGL